MMRQAVPPRNKILPLEALAVSIRDFKQQGLKVVLANGCFDLLHVGHVRYLFAAKAVGDILVVAVNSDRSVHRLKGDGRPVQPEIERAELVASLASVDFVTIFDHQTVEPVIRALRPHFQCKGTDYSEEDVPEREVVRAMGGEVKIVGDTTDHATRDLIARIRRLSRP